MEAKLSAKRLKEYLRDFINKGLKKYPKELDYLVLTSKFENQFRDRFAYYLYKKLKKWQYAVAREYRRRDITIFRIVKGEKNKIANLEETLGIELKAAYSFDYFKSGKKGETVLENFIGSLNTDMTNKKAYGIFLITDIKDPGNVSNKFEAITHKQYKEKNFCIIKYLQDIIKLGNEKKPNSFDNVLTDEGFEPMGQIKRTSNILNFPIEYSLWVYFKPPIII